MRFHTVQSWIAVTAVLFGALVAGPRPGGATLSQQGARGPAIVERLTITMGTELRVRVHGDTRDEAEAAAEAAIREVERLDALLGTWSPDSPLSTVRDTAADTPVDLSSELISLLYEAEAWAERTGRAFDPAVGALVDAWDLRGDGRIPTDAELGRATAATGAGVLQIDSARGTVTRATPLGWVDTGAFGKGAALRSAAEVLLALGIQHALLDLGGQFMVLGDADPGSGTGWRIGVARPSHRMEPLTTLLVSDVSVATSGASERGVEIDGRRFGHILDPRTGRPAPAWGSVTVVAADAFVADALATALFVLGPDAALDWARDRHDVGVLVAEAGDPLPRMRWTPAMETWLDTNDLPTQRR